MKIQHRSSHEQFNTTWPPGPENGIRDSAAVWTEAWPTTQACYSGGGRRAGKPPPYRVPIGPLLAAAAAAAATRGHASAVV